MESLLSQQRREIQSPCTTQGLRLSLLAASLNEIITQGESGKTYQLSIWKIAYSAFYRTHCQKLLAVIQFCCKKLHESLLQRCVYMAKFLVEVISDLDELWARYLSTDVPLLDFFKTQTLTLCSSKLHAVFGILDAAN